MADKPIREQSALELLETHAKALEGYCMENARLRAALTKYLPLAESHLLMIAHREDLSISADAKDRLRELQALKNSLRGAVETSSAPSAAGALTGEPSSTREGSLPAAVGADHELWRVSLPMITPDIFNMHGGPTLLIDMEEGGKLDWTQAAVDFACMLQGERKHAVETTPKPHSQMFVASETGWCMNCRWAFFAHAPSGRCPTDKTVPELNQQLGTVETPDGYKDAYYQIADLLGMSAMPISPKEAFERHMLPRLRQLVSAAETAAKYGTCAVCGGVGGAHFTYCKDSPLKAAERQR